MVKAFTPWGVEVNFYTLWCNGQHCKEYPMHFAYSGEYSADFEKLSFQTV